MIRNKTSHRIPCSSYISHVLLFYCLHASHGGHFQILIPTFISWYKLWPQTANDNYTQKWLGTKKICPTKPKWNVSSSQLWQARSSKCHFSATQQTPGKVRSGSISIDYSYVRFANFTKPYNYVNKLLRHLPKLDKQGFLKLNG